MKTKTIGIILIVIGIIMIGYRGLHYVTTEKVVDLGPIQINKEENHIVPWYPIISLILIVGGIVVVVSDKRIRV